MTTPSTLKLLALAMLVGFTATSASAATFTNTVIDVENKPVDLEWTYTVNTDGEATITRMTNLVDTTGVDTLYIPSNVYEIVIHDNGTKVTNATYLVTEMNSWFSQSWNQHETPNKVLATMKKVVLPITLTKTSGSNDDGKWPGVFRACKSLTNAVMPGLTYIDKAMFRNCVNLETVEIDWSKVTAVNGYAFNSCSKLQIPELDLSHFTTIQVGSFLGTKITSLKIPNVKTIGALAFSNCDSLTTVDMVNVESIGKQAFYYCPKLGGDIILPKLTSLGDSAFYKQNGVTDEGLPGKLILPLLETIPDQQVFQNCSFITNVVLPRLKTMSTKWTFRGAGGFEKFKFPYCMERLFSTQNTTFENTYVTNFFIHAMSPFMFNYAGSDCIFDETETLTLKTLLARTADTVEIIPYGGVYTNDVAGTKTEWFYDDRDTPGYDLSATSVTIVGSTNATGAVTLPDRVEFADGTSKKVTAVGMSAFYNMSGITSIRLGKYVERVGLQAFYKCNDLKKIEVYEGNTTGLLEHLTTLFGDTEVEVVPYSGGGLKVIVR